jgi:hypothetical protein
MSRPVIEIQGFRDAGKKIKLQNPRDKKKRLILGKWQNLRYKRQGFITNSKNRIK